METNFNEWADFWFHDMGINVLSADTVDKKPTEEWSEYQNKPMPPELFEKRKKDGLYKNGIALIPGKVWRGPNKGKYLVFIDLDNQRAIDEVCSCFGAKDLEELSRYIIVERHKGDLSKAHLYFYSDHEFRKKSSDVAKLGGKIKDNEIPAIEVKGSGEQGIAFCSPSLHRDGTRYEIIGTKEPKTCRKEVEDRLLEIYKKYNLDIDKDNQKIPIKGLFKKDFVIFEGHNRHEGLLRVMESLISRNKKILSEEKIKKLATEWNQEHCRPPLDDEKFEEQWKDAKKFIEKNNNDDRIKKEEKGSDEDKEQNKTPQEILMEIAEKNIETLFKDQHNDGFVTVSINSDYEVIPLTSNRFTRLLTMIYHNNTGKFANTESINNVVNTLRAKAEFGDTQYPLSLRVAEHGGDIYYDLTNERHQAIKISQNGIWEIIDKTPVPLFKRHNQTPQTLPFAGPLSDDEQDPLDTFISKMTNIKDEETRLIAKVTLVSWFIPDIPHILLIVHGGKGSAKSMFLTLVKSIVDPAKPSLLTIHDDKSEFIQQLAHNYLAAYDNLRYNPKWLSDECCKAITGIGQTKRVVYTIDDDKIFEYKHCLMFNGINIAFSEPDVIDRSIPIELYEIMPEHRRTEKEILEEFNKLKPKILKQIFDILAKAITVKKDVNVRILPRMADSAIWGEAISRAMGYKENAFLDAYYNNIKIQNAEVIDSNPVAFAIKKFVEHVISANDDVLNSYILIFNGTPAEFLEELNKIAAENKIGTFSREWPKEQRWLVRRINVIKPNLQQELGIEIRIERDSNNTSLIKIEKNDSGDSGKHKMSPGNASLTPYLEKMSPGNGGLSPEDIEDLSTKLNASGDIGDIGDIFKKLEGDGDDKINSALGGTTNQDMAHLIIYKEPFYYCKQHLNVQNIHREEIEHHIQYSREHLRV